MVFSVEDGVHPNACSFHGTGTNGHAVILTHGLSGSLFHYREMAADLLASGFTVYGLRLPGHGTHPDDLLDIRCEDYQESADSLVEQVLQTSESVSFIGGSLGGNVLLHFASRHANNPRLHRIVIVDAPILVPGAWWYRPILPLIRRVSPYYQKPWARKDRTDGEYFTEHGSYRYMPIIAVEEFYRFIDDFTRPVLSQITQPVLIIQSRRDNVILPKSAKYLQSHLTNTHVELRWVESGEHVPFLNLPASFRETIVRFLEKDLY
ncbi:MAG: alpha/beta fold hydrolase [Candidatus Kerfeldbacteria bacterium]|nr:alpha/beta fold hydrolase [Candidatus Kerfeldbacteria bacterium]